MKNRLEVRSVEPLFDYEDALMLTCLICGVLVNVLLFKNGIWQCRLLSQKLLIYAIASPSFAYAGFGIFRKVISFFERRR